MNPVLIVDDKSDNRYYLQSLLTANGYEVETAEDGAEALAKAKEKPPVLVVSDLLMPVMDGYSLLRHWKSDRELINIPFIVYTATYTTSEDEKLALDLGADAFLLKPLDPEDFLARVREVQAAAAANGCKRPKLPPEDDRTLLRFYSESLIRKLEEKTLQLEKSSRQLAQDALERIKAQEERDRLFNLSGDLLCVFSFDGRIEQVNPAWTRCLGWTAAELTGRLAEDFVHADDLLETLRVRAELNEGQPVQFENRYHCKDGSCRWLSWNSHPLRETRQVFAIARDVTLRKEMDAKLREQAALLDKAQDAILVRDLDHRILYWNKSAEKLYGWSAAEVVGRQVSDLLYQDDSNFLAATAATWANGEWVGEINQLTKSGQTITVEGRWTLVRDDQGRPKSILAINTDITERRNLERHFLRSQRIESIGTLAGGIAHDLNNVLAPIMMSVDLLRSHIRSPEGLEILEMIGKSAHRGAEMVGQVLTFARGVERKNETVDLTVVIHELLRIIEETFPKNIKIVTAMAPALWSMKGDSTQIHQVLLNLCVNARDAMEDGGLLHLRVSNRMVEEPAGTDGPFVPGPYLWIEVRDTGPGIRAEDIEKLFDPYFTTKEVGKGTGLGLSTSLAITKSHGGQIRAFNHPGGGACFEIYLPAVVASPFPVPDLPNVVPRHGRGQTVLVVDDEPTIREITRQALEAHGYTVILAANGADAGIIYFQHRQDISVVITDMMMPHMDGPRTVSALRRLNPSLPIIGASGIASYGNPESLGAEELDHFLLKPFTTATLLAAIEKVLGPSD